MCLGRDAASNGGSHHLSFVGAFCPSLAAARPAPTLCPLAGSMTHAPQLRVVSAQGLDPVGIPFVHVPLKVS